MVCIMFLKSDKAKKAGGILSGFGILFMGLIYMSASVSTMGDSLGHLLTAFEDNYFLGFLSGIVVTGIIQSSSAVVGILQSMASSMGVRFCGVFAVILGVNIGDCLTTFIVSRIGAKPEQIRTALVHVIYNIFAASLITILLSLGRMTGLLGDSLWYATLNSGGVANVHGIFRLLPAVCLLPLTGLFAKIAERIVPDAPKDAEDQEIEQALRALDYHLINSPAIALGQAAQLISYMASVALHNYDAVQQQIENYDEDRAKRIDHREEMLDQMADAANRYVVEVSPYISEEADGRNQDFQIKALTCFERMGDHAVNITDDLKELREHGGSFSPNATKELHIALDAVGEILGITYNAYKTHDLLAATHVEPLEEVIDDLIKAMRANHIYRMTHGLCEIYSGLQFENILSNLERLSDQCSDLAVFMLSHDDPGLIGQEHQYVHDLHRSQDPTYQTLFQSNFAKYFGQLDAVTPPGTDPTA